MIKDIIDLNEHSRLIAYPHFQYSFSLFPNIPVDMEMDLENYSSSVNGPSMHFNCIFSTYISIQFFIIIFNTVDQNGSTSWKIFSSD